MPTPMTRKRAAMAMSMVRLDVHQVVASKLDGSDE